MISSLNVFGNDHEPEMNLHEHCNPNPPINLGAEIKVCQKLGIKVLLSLGGPQGIYSIASSKDAKDVDDYIWNNFLGGKTKTTSGVGVRPFGDAILDGVDFDIELSRSNMHWDDLALELSKHSTPKRKVYLSASPAQCFIPDDYLDEAIKTGVFDYVWVHFYSSRPCQYEAENPDEIFSSWEEWHSFIRPSGRGKLFMGLPAARVGASKGGGYIPTELLIHHILPYIKSFSSYGGVMLWNNYYDTYPQYYYSIHIL